MIVGLRTIGLFIPDAHSLKDKRQVLRKIKDRIKAKFNVSYAEIEYLDKWQRSTLGLVTIGTKREDVDARLDEILNFILEDDRITVLEVEREYL